jgi:hypothetical protein
MEKELIVRLRVGNETRDLPALLVATGTDAAAQFERRRSLPGVHLLLVGDRDYYVTLREPVAAATRDLVLAHKGRSASAIFPGRKPVRRRLVAVAVGVPAEVVPGKPLDLTAGLRGAPPLFLLADGRLSATAGPPETGMALLPTLVTAARWISSRRTSTFEQLFPPSAFHPDEPVRTERLSAAQAEGLLGQLREALAVAAVGGAEAAQDATQAGQLRSAALTVLSHIVATVRKDPTFRAVADAAAQEIFALIEREHGDTAFPALRAHAIQLLKLRGPALSKPDQERAAALLRGLIRQAPPYDELPDTWRFAMCSAYDFHEGEVEILIERYNFKKIDLPADAPKAPGWRGHYDVLEAPFKGPKGQPIQVFGRAASPSDENHEMGLAYFVGILINRHAQLGSFDMQASTTQVRQVGYKLMMNSQCAGLTTRFAIAKVFPDADIYSSWDSTYFNTGRGGKVTASEGVDCFVALLEGMGRGESHAQITERMKAVQWYHKQASFPGFVQFIGPAHPEVVGRFIDVNQDGRADFYDGFLDLQIKAIAQDLQQSSTPRDPGVPGSQIGGDAAKGLGWAAGSLNRVIQYSDLWAALPGNSEGLYPFSSGGFFSHREPPHDVPVGDKPPLVQALGRLPAVCRYLRDDSPAGFSAEVMFHGFLSHAADELKRLLCAAEAMWRALDIGLLPSRGLLATPLGQRGAVLLMLAGLLEFPADQNFIDGIWGMALKMLNLPELSRTVVRACITDADHDASNYYGSVRGLKQLLGEKLDGGALRKADPAAFERLASADPQVGRAAELTLPE